MADEELNLAVTREHVSKTRKSINESSKYLHEAQRIEEILTGEEPLETSQLVSGITDYFLAKARMNRSLLNAEDVFAEVHGGRSQNRNSREVLVQEEVQYREAVTDANNGNFGKIKFLALARAKKLGEDPKNAKDMVMSLRWLKIASQIPGEINPPQQGGSRR
jgi:hypothetical protein